MAWSTEHTYKLKMSDIGSWNTECIQNSNGSPSLGFPVVFRNEQNGGQFAQIHWKSDQNAKPLEIPTKWVPVS